MALRRYILHSIDPDFLNIQRSSLASWCVRSLKSSIRELRIVAGYVLCPEFLSLIPPCVSHSICLAERSRCWSVTWN